MDYIHCLTLLEDIFIKAVGDIFCRASQKACFETLMFAPFIPLKKSSNSSWRLFFTKFNIKTTILLNVILLLPILVKYVFLILVSHMNIISFVSAVVILIPSER